jgi:hypothetical protein
MVVSFRLSARHRKMEEHSVNEYEILECMYNIWYTRTWEMPHPGEWGSVSPTRWYEPRKLERCVGQKIALWLFTPVEVSTSQRHSISCTLGNRGTPLPDHSVRTRCSVLYARELDVVPCSCSEAVLGACAGSAGVCDSQTSQCHHAPLPVWFRNIMTAVMPCTCQHFMRTRCLSVQKLPLAHPSPNFVVGKDTKRSGRDLTHA